MPHRLTVGVLIVGLALTGVLSGLSRVNYLDNEQRLVTLQTRLTASSLAVAPIDVQRRLGRAVSLVTATNDADEFRRAIAASITKAGPFTAVLLYRITGGAPRRVLALGGTTLLTPDSKRATDLFAAAAKAGSLQLIRLLAPGQQRLGYTLAAEDRGNRYVAYAEQVLPADRRVTLPPGSPLEDVHFALYLGTKPDQRSLLETDADHLPLTGTTATTTLAFGNRTVTLVSSPRGSLVGRFAQAVAWLIAAVGVVVTLGMALLAERLVRRRAYAEELAAVNRRLYHGQRSVAETLQHSLLPRRLPEHAELDMAVRYLPGTEGIEVGGDWYDVVNMEDGSVFFTVGDVSGRGLDAAILMATLRNTIRAHVADGDGPATVLAKLSRLVDVAHDGRFATVVCGRIDLRTGVVTIANAGHPGPILIQGAQCAPVQTAIGAPVGIGEDYPTIDLRLRTGDTLLAYTDGLVERRGEAIDAGIERLCRAIRPALSLDRVLDHVLEQLVPAGASDDIAVLGLRWHG